MLYAIHLLDRPGTAALRTRMRPEHRAYLGESAERIAFAGPLLADDGQTMVGSLMVMEFASREDVEHWLRNEPFTRAGLYACTAIHAFTNLWPQKAGLVSD